MRVRTSTLICAALLGAVAGPGAGTLEAQELQRYEVDRAESALWVVTHRGGLFSFLGHEHAILPGEWSADLCLADPIPEGARGTIRIRTASLTIDTDSARALAEMGDGPGDEDRIEIQSKMLDSTNLAAEQHPEIRLEMQAVGSLQDGTVPVRGSVRVRGVTVDVELDLEVERGGEGVMDPVTLAGAFEVKQSAFGIDPESIAGLVKVSDEIDLHLRLTAVPTAESCTGTPGGGR